MFAEVITIGDEILIGQTIDTNSAWLAESLHLIGVDLNRIVTISDRAEEIVSAIDESFARVDLILMTGGLGPTQDDVTKETLAAYFNTTLETNQEVLNGITSYFKSRGFPMLDVNMKQADLPKDADILMNKRGTAMGMWFERNGKVLISMPGVPYEMKGIMRDYGLEKIKAKFSPNSVVHQTILTQGLGESFIAERMSAWETKLRSEGLSLAYLPSPGSVKMRISGMPIKGQGAQMLERIAVYFEEVKAVFPENVFGQERDTLASVVGKLLSEVGATLATAESCTGGHIAELITATPGASVYFNGGVVAYSNGAKQTLLGVNAANIKTHGAVSEIVAKQMATGARSKFNTTFAVSTTGVAGPDGGSDGKPIGTVWIGIAGPTGVKARKFSFGKSRSRNITVSAITALNWLRNEIISGGFELSE